MKKAGIIGGADFIGCYITIKFLAENFLVKVPVPHHKKVLKPLIFTGISANENLEYCRTNMKEVEQIRHFIQDCDILIHCGSPVKLGINENGIPIYIPVIENIGILLQIVREISTIQKVILLLSPLVYFTESKSIRHSAGNKSGKILASDSWLKSTKSDMNARFHAEKVMTSIHAFSEKLIEFIIVSPVEVSDNKLKNSVESTSAGLRLMLKKNIKMDPFIQKLFHGKIINSMENIVDLPDIVFDKACTLK